MDLDALDAKVTRTHTRFHELSADIDKIIGDLKKSHDALSQLPALPKPSGESKWESVLPTDANEDPIQHKARLLLAQRMAAISGNSAQPSSQQQQRDREAKLKLVKHAMETAQTLSEKLNILKHSTIDTFGQPITTVDALFQLIHARLDSIRLDMAASVKVPSPAQPGSLTSVPYPKMTPTEPPVAVKSVSYSNKVAVAAEDKKTHQSNTLVAAESLKQLTPTRQNVAAPETASKHTSNRPATSIAPMAPDLAAAEETSKSQPKHPEPSAPGPAISNPSDKVDVGARVVALQQKILPQPATSSTQMMAEPPMKSSKDHAPSVNQTSLLPSNASLTKKDNPMSVDTRIEKSKVTVAAPSPVSLRQQAANIGRSSLPASVSMDRIPAEPKETEAESSDAFVTDSDDDDASFSPMSAKIPFKVVDTQIPANTHQVTPVKVDAPYVVVRAIYDYDAQTDEELSFKESQSMVILPDLKHVDALQYVARSTDPFALSDDWLYATLARSAEVESFVSGWVPANYIEIVLDSRFDSKKGAKYRALFDYNRSKPDELTFAEGTEFRLIRAIDDGWLQCMVSRVAADSVSRVGEIGVVPITYVEMEEGSMEPASPSTPPAEEENPFESIVSDVEPLANVSMSRSTNIVHQRSVPLVPTLTTVQVEGEQASASNQRTGHRRNRSRTLPSLHGRPDLLDLTQSHSQRRTWVESVDVSISSKFHGDDRKRQEAIFELIWTERTYVADLLTVLEVFYEPIRTMNLLPQSDLEGIFCNIRKLYETNMQILVDLTALQEASSFVIDNLSSILRRYSSAVDQEDHSKEFSLMVYLTYCSNQSSASQLLQSRRKANAPLAQFLKGCMMNPRCRSLDLSSFLLEPMQRITRYPLLIKQILHYTSKDHPDHSELLAVLKQMEILLTRVNTATKDSANRAQMEELVKMIDMSPLISQGDKLDLLSPTRFLGPRELLHQGTLWKAKSGRKLHCFLFNDLIVLCDYVAENKYAIYRTVI